MRQIKSQYRLIAREDLVELLASLTSKYSSMDPETGNPREINLLKSEINAIQKEILKRGKGSPDNARNDRTFTDAP